MTNEEAANLQKGDTVLFKGKEWKVKYVQILLPSKRVKVKLQRGNDKVYGAPPDMMELAQKNKFD